MSDRAFAKTLVVATGALLRGRVAAPGLVALETVEPRHRRPWRVVRERDLPRHVEEWAAGRGVTLSVTPSVTVTPVTPDRDATEAA